MGPKTVSRMATRLRGLLRGRLPKSDVQPPPMPFVVGVARSGTTLLRLMLDAHPQLAIPAETHFLVPVSKLSGSGEELRKAFFETVTGFETWEDLDVDADQFRDALRDIHPFSVAAGCRCFFQLYAAKRQKPRWGDKSPPYNLHMDTLSVLLPEAHFIHIIRDGRDMAISLRHLCFSPGSDMSTLAHHWCETIATARHLAKNCPHYLELRYEDLLSNPRQELDRICRFIDLPFDTSMLDYHRQAKSRLNEVKTRYRPDGSIVLTKDDRLHNHRFTSQPPDMSRSGRWRTEMTLAEREVFEGIAGSLLREMGYEIGH